MYVALPSSGRKAIRGSYGGLELETLKQVQGFECEYWDGINRQYSLYLDCLTPSEVRALAKRILGERRAKAP